jgi:amidase
MVLLKMTTTESNWEEIAAVKRAALLASIPSEWLIPTHSLPSEDEYDLTKFRVSSGFFTEEEIKITEATLYELADKIRRREWSAERVVTSFCKAAAVAHQLVSF